MVMNRHHPLARDELVRALIAYTGTTTDDGNIGGTTLQDRRLIGSNDFISNKTILIGSGDTALEDSGAVSFAPLTGIITVSEAYSAQIKAGTLFRVLNISTVEIDVDVINTKIGTNTDPAGTNTLFAWLANIFGGVGTTQGLVYYGVVTEIPGANQFTIPTLAGFGNTAFVDWTAYVFWDTAGVDAAPQREQQAIATYDSATGIFSTGAFTAPVAVGDIILILHPRIADITTILTRANDLISMAGLNIFEGTVTANWNTGVGTSGEAGEDLLGGASPQSAIPSITLLHSLLLDVDALTDGAKIHVKLFMNINSNERKVYDQEFTVPTTALGETPPPDTLGLWIVNGTLALHADLRVEVYSDTNENVAIGYTYATGAIHA